MTERERKFADLGFDYSEGIDMANVVIVPATGREIKKKANGKWECQPRNDNWWAEFDDLLDAAKVASFFCLRCNDTGIDQTERCEGRLTGCACVCEKGRQLQAKYEAEAADLPMSKEMIKFNAIGEH